MVLIPFSMVIKPFISHLDDIFFQWAKAGARAAVRRPWPIEKKQSKYKINGF